MFFWFQNIRVIYKKQINYAVQNVILKDDLVNF